MPPPLVLAIVLSVVVLLGSAVGRHLAHGTLA
jgi:hypothetical protein